MVVVNNYPRLNELIVFVVSFILLISPDEAQGALKRCFQCRSRSELGSCKDPFLYNNATAIEHVAGIKTVPCASGWCGKILEGGANQFKDEEYGVATERLCFQRGPSDNEERCAPAQWGNSKVQMCFCTGDLCNGSTGLSHIDSFTTLATLFTAFLTFIAAW